MKHALHCGELLLAAKKLVGHGEWLPWLAANCTVSERTAQAYIRVASRRPELEEKAQQRCGFEDLSFRQGLKLLAEPTKPTKTATELFEDEARPDSKYIPPKERYLCGTRDGTTVYIAHAEKHPGYCFVTRHDFGELKEDNLSVVETPKRPVRNDFIESALDRLRVDAASLVWEEVPCDPWPENPYWIPDDRQQQP
jgi:hypothetical protein